MSGSGWKFDVPTSGSKQLPPDPRYVEALSSQGYGFEVAVADLVDNSIDAGARDVVVHFLRDGDRLVSLLVVDDGHGMDEDALDVAMTVGGQRDYAPGALGMFGTGLKSASLSHADAVTVVSKTKRTRAAGRRWLTAHAVDGFRCDIVDPGYSQDLVDRYAGRPITWQGTVVRWDGVKDFPQHGGGGQTDRYLTRVISRLGLHLGLHLHRFLARDDFNITIAVEDVRTGTVYMDYGVVPLDPFGYPASGVTGYPRRWTAPVEGLGEIALTAHIWPPKSNLDEYRAVGPVQERQGFYFYRNDRLVQAGGWNGYRQPDQHLALARVAVDLPPSGGDVLRLTVKKSGVNASPAFAAALESAAYDAEGRGFKAYLDDADQAYRDARKRSGTVRKAVIPPGRGLPPEVRRTVQEELPVLYGEEPIAVRWDRLGSDLFFDVDRENRAIVLNQRYRAALLGGRRGGLNDAPVLKSLLYLLLHKVFESEYAGPREKDNLQLWQAVLLSAARSELDRADDTADGPDGAGAP
ncbi:ATP-binding protein [Streptacidiphilus sp. ASG 303]|uniref:ATP-binding protein n=1 Tax=Streptacidiphilus sp. ASG 303 TaxID=2896847 RepID=UPI001E6039CD|nr:ATP-binding protein [Streptacidiphilus sp. ASG 303]MCD0486165.1 ATP-binding protein [Streptacidiphilus sp. ASG 303]